MENLEKLNNTCRNGAFADAVREITDFIRKELIFRGSLFLLLGILMMFRPGQTLLFITVMIGLFILIDGISTLFSALKYHGQGKALWVLHAVFLILLGFYTCTAPLMMNIIWVIVVGFWQLFNGVQCLGFRTSAGKSAVFSGLCSIVAGLILIFMPVLGMMALMWIMGLLSFLCGLSVILLGLRLKKNSDMIRGEKKDQPLNAE